MERLSVTYCSCTYLLLLIQHLQQEPHNSHNSKDKDESVTIWLSIPYIGEKMSQLLCSFKRKLHRHLKNPYTQIKIREKTTKLCFYTNNKTNSVVPAACHHTLAKLTEPFSHEHVNTL